MLPSNCTGKVNGKAPLLDQTCRRSLNWGNLEWKRQGPKEEKKPMVVWIFLYFPCILETEDAAPEIAKDRAFLCIVYYYVSSRKPNPSAGYVLRDVKKKMSSHSQFPLKIILSAGFLPRKENLNPIHCHPNTHSLSLCSPRRNLCFHWIIMKLQRMPQLPASNTYWTFQMRNPKPTGSLWTGTCVFQAEGS